MNLKKRSCINMQNNFSCNRGDKCRFAHSPSELNIKNCNKDNHCPYIRIKDKRVGFWKVLNLEKVCPYKHSSEDLVNFFLRIGWQISAENIKKIYMFYQEKDSKEELVKESKEELVKESKEELVEESKEELVEESKEGLVKRCKATVKKTGKICNNKIKDLQYDFCGKHKKFRKDVNNNK